MDISVIIPTYKPQNYIWKCLDSLCNQTLSYGRFEIIVVLNGCKEPYYTQIWRYINNHPMVNWRYLQTDQGGVSNARNIALDAAIGDYITFIDDDDYVSPDFLELMLEKASTNTIVVSNVFAFDDDTPTIQRQYRLTDSYNRLKTLGCVYHPTARKFFCCPWMKLIPIEIIKGRRFNTKFKNGEDSLFMFVISDQYKDVVFAPDEAIYYRRYRSGSAVTTKRNPIDVIINELKLLYAMLAAYIPRFWSYNFKFALGNFLSTIHGMMER